MTDEPKNLIRDLSFQFSIDLIETLNKLPKTAANLVITKQCFRSGTSIGANVEEAIGASSKKEFTHCMTISRREARETRYWLRLLVATNPRCVEELTKRGIEVNTLIKVLNSIVRSSRER